MEEVKERFREKFGEAEKVEVVRVCKEDSGRIRWWFWLKGEEDVLGRLDGVVMDDIWRVEKWSPFRGRISEMVLEEWCSRWGMKVNVEKSAIIHFRKKSCLQWDHEFSIGGEVIPIVTKYKYLGCVID